MFEKVNPSHPDKIADRIAGALVDLAYAKERNPRIAVEVLIGHGECNIIAETSVSLEQKAIEAAVCRIAGEGIKVNYKEVPQDIHLANNQLEELRCGDNGIFRGTPITDEERHLTGVVRELYEKYPYDGKFIAAGDALIVCQSNAKEDEIRQNVYGFPNVFINPLGYWTGGIDVDTGATNRKLGSDMGGAVTGGGLHGKDLSRADVSVNIYAHIVAQKNNRGIKIACAIGDVRIDGFPYSAIVEIARDYIERLGGFEKFAEWGLIR